MRLAERGTIQGVITRRTLLLGSAGVAVSAVAGCSDDGNGAGSSSSATSEPPPSSATPTPSRFPSPTPTPTPTTSRSPSATRPPNPKVSGTIARNLNVPWGIAFLRSGDALVSERDSGRIVRISRGGRVRAVGEVAGAVGAVSGGEGGLMGIALAPGDEETLFAYVTTDSDDRIIRCSLAGGRVGRPRPILTGIPSRTRHHGGRLLFDRQGLLFVSTGDAEDSSTAANRRSITGKILRLRPDGRAAPGNPYGNRVWSYGHRNIEGLAFDRGGRLWATEFGDQEADELNLITKGRNYGWPRVEGRSNQPGLVTPKVVWSPTDTCSPAGLAIINSTAFVGALRGQCLFTVPLQGTIAGKPRAYFAEDYGRIRSMAAAPDGSLWMTTSNTDGRGDPGRDDDMILRVSL
jgi:glucose/arabinose dehydrogenase